MRVGEILPNVALAEKVSIHSGCSVHQALVVMAKADVGALLVVDDLGAVIGIFSERDYARKIILQGRRSHNTRVKDVMSDKVIYVSPEMTAEYCLSLMVLKKVRHMPVVDKTGRCLGFLSIGDVVVHLVEKRNFLIDQLHKYIAGSQYANLSADDWKNLKAG